MIHVCTSSIYLCSYCSLVKSNPVTYHMPLNVTTFNIDRFLLTWYCGYPCNKIKIKKIKCPLPRVMVASAVLAPLVFLCAVLV